MCLAREQGAVCFIETAEDKGGAWLHDSHEVGHIGQKDVAIDVGEDNVELSSETTEHGAIATERRQTVVHMVDNGIMARIVCTPLVDIVAYAGAFFFNDIIQNCMQLTNFIRSRLLYKDIFTIFAFENIINLYIYININ